MHAIRLLQSEELYLYTARSPISTCLAPTMAVLP